MGKYKQFLLKVLDLFLPTRRIVLMQGDELPDRLPKRNVVLTVDDGEPYLIGMRCPCGCGKRLEMIAADQINPHWKISSDHKGRVTLHPSVNLQVDCLSHFWLRKGRVKWC